MIEIFDIPGDIISRPIYLDKALKYINKDVVKIFTGQRRVGKTYLLYQIAQHLLKQNKSANIIFINKELPAFGFIKTDSDLINYITDKEQATNNYLLIDEVQEIAGFEKALRAILAGRKWDIWCTGSNASLLSKDIAGIISGRTVEINVAALSYVEFLVFHKLSDNDASLNKYLKYGGLPYLVHLELDDNTVFEYLKGIYNTILFKDVVARHNIRNIGFLENLVSFSACNIGSLLSANRISEYLKSQGIKMPAVRVLEYLSYLVDAFFLIKLKRADIKGKKIFEIGEKYFFEDIGLRNMIAGYRPEDINKIIENVVLLHLKMQGYKVYTASMGLLEIDFVCQKGNQKIYVQVAYLIPDQKVYNREFGNLKKIQDNFPKYVVSMDPVKWDADMGILHYQLREFLKMKI